jgi:hypothetical protein
MTDAPITRPKITAVFVAMLAFAVVAALFGTFVPPLLQLGEGGAPFRWAALAAATFGAIMAVVMRAYFLKHLPAAERKTGTIQRR